jgi:aryl-alcohol dehydrogenase-like predicted oxidoreductase
VSHIRGGHTRFDADNISRALNDSLSRLQTDYIDLYQLHWPERKTNYFGKLGYQADSSDADLTPVYETLQALEKEVRAGKIRYIGLSNETPWGIMQFLWTARVLNLPAVATVQNPYSLLNRTYEVGCAEISHREDVGLMAYSPLGFGVLTGKYLDAEPTGARLTRWPHYARYSNEQAVAATREYVQLAKRYQLDPAQMALAFVNSRPFLSANIIGATDMQQLKNNIASIDLELDDALLDEVETIHRRYPNPSP